MGKTIDWLKRADDSLEKGLEKWKGAGADFRKTKFHQRGWKTMRNWSGLEPFDKKLWAKMPGTDKYEHSLFSRLGGIGRLMGVGFLAHSAYEGYQEGGLGGAAKGVGSFLATNYALGALGIPALGLAAAGALVGGAAYAGLSAAGVRGFGMPGLFKSNVERWRAEHKSIALGTPVLDPYGTGATLRSRAVQAIQGSRINGMNALGNEASLLYSPYFR